MNGTCKRDYAIHTLFVNKSKVNAKCFCWSYRITIVRMWMMRKSKMRCTRTPSLIVDKIDAQALFIYIDRCIVSYHCSICVNHFLVCVFLRTIVWKKVKGQCSSIVMQWEIRYLQIRTRCLKKKSNSPDFFYISRQEYCFLHWPNTFVVQ